MGNLTEIVKKITQQVEDKYHFTVDNFIIEKEQPIGKTEQLNEPKSCYNCVHELLDKDDIICLSCGFYGNHKFKEEQLSSSEKPNNHIKIRFCCICGKRTEGGSVCQSDECFDKFEKL